MKWVCTLGTIFAIIILDLDLFKLENNDVSLLVTHIMIISLIIWGFSPFFFKPCNSTQ